LEDVIKIHIDKGSRIPLEKVRKWAIEMSKGLSFLHEKQVIHFDVKPENIFLTAMERVKLGDLGVARNKKTVSICLRYTENYASPEIIGRTIRPNEKSDIWSFGCVIYELLELKALFEERDRSVLLYKIKNGIIQMPKNLDDLFTDVLTK
jgi:NIMA (never in mitosis gene a)-related kinase